MRDQLRRTLGHIALGVTLSVALAGRAGAVDGVVEINQAAALAGAVTPGDTPGFPVTISEAGSYRLTGNLDVTGQPNPENVTAVEASANHVTLDLNGFAIIGPTVCSGATEVTPVTSCSPTGLGVGISGADHISVRGGTVTGMGGSGIALGEASRIENARLISNGGGIVCARFCTLVNNIVRHNGDGGVGAAGIFGFALTATGNTVLHNMKRGIHSWESSVVSGNTVLFNGKAGIWVGAGSAVTGNTVRGPGVPGVYEDGIHVTGTPSFTLGSTVSGNTVSGSHEDGIDVDSPSLVTGNTVANSAAFNLNLRRSDIGYSNNVLRGSQSGAVNGGVQIGTNLCDGSVCP